MDYITILAEATNRAAEAEPSLVPIDSIWDSVTSLNMLEAGIFISFGAVCVIYGWRVFKLLVVICFALLGLLLGMTITERLAGGNQFVGGLIGLAFLAILSVPLMRWSVSILGAVAGGILSAGIWHACGLTEKYIWAGALIGVIGGGMISFIIFKIAVMLFSSLGGAALVVTGALSLLYQYQNYRSQPIDSIKDMFYQTWFLPVLLLAATAIGVAVQSRLVKGSKEWNL